VLDAMVAHYTDLPRTLGALHEGFRDPDAADLDGRFVKAGERLHFNFGKYRGRPLDEVAQRDPSYLEWMLAQDFFDDAKALAAEALACPV
jgi:hypothetical protein